MTPVRGDSFIATKSAGADFNSVSRNADASDITTPDVGDSEAALPTAESISGRMGIPLKRLLSSPVVWTLIVLILSGVGILRELL
jgi:hypothetical protein